jgi:hypothetical protein
MRNIAIGFLKLIVGLVLFVSCNNGSGSDIKTYSYTTPIVDPPATFNIVFNIGGYGDRVAEVTFSQNAVWKIEKLGDGRVNMMMNTGNNNLTIISSDTLGLQADKVYYVVVNNNNYSEFNNYFVGFTNLGLDYASFEPKF